MALQWLRDTLANFVTGLGTAKDPRMSNQYTFKLLDRNELENVYRGDWVARRIVDCPAEDATRAWRNWEAAADEAKEIKDVEKKLDIQRKLKWTIQRARLYGGAALVLGVEQGNTWEPLDLEKVGKDALKFVAVLNRYELMAGPRIYNVFSEWYTRPEYYTVATPLFGFSFEGGEVYPDTNGNSAYADPNNQAMVIPPRREGQAPKQQQEGDFMRQQTPAAGMVRIHPSRVIEFSGNPLPDWRLAPMGGGWGDSVLQTADDMLKNWGMTVGGIANIINDCKMDVVRIPDFSKSLAQKEYADRLINRFTVANAGKSMINTLLLDHEEEWERIQTNFGGLPNMVRELLTVVSGAAGIPLTRLIGQSPGSGLGEGTTGGGADQDLRNYYDMISYQQETDYSPTMKNLDQCIIRSALGYSDPDIYYDWSPLWESSDDEKAGTALKKAQATSAYAQMGLLNEDVLRRGTINQLIEDGTYPGLQDAIEEFGEEPETPEPMIGTDPKTGLPLSSGELPLPKQLPKSSPLHPDNQLKQLGPPKKNGNAKVKDAKIEKENVNFRDGAPRENCGLCSMYRDPNKCTAVAGRIEEEDVCDLFEPKRGPTLDFDPDQPRDPQGKWTSGGGSAAPAGEDKPKAEWSKPKVKAEYGEPSEFDHPGHGYSKNAIVIDGVIHTDDVHDAARALWENRKVELHQPRQVSTLLEHLGQVSKHMIRLGGKAPTFNLCNVSVTNSNLFCAETLGIPRAQMPQIEDVGGFKEYLKGKGYKIDTTTEQAAYLRATQNELNGGKVAAVAAKMKTDEALRNRSIVVSKDNYVLDGHHTWAAKVGLDAEDGILGDDTRMNVERVSIGIVPLLQEAEAFTGGKGHKGLKDAKRRGSVRRDSPRRGKPA